MEKLEFYLGDIVYLIDADYHFYEERIKRVELERDNTVTYSTGEVDFAKSDIGTLIFKTELDRELYLESILDI